MTVCSSNLRSFHGVTSDITETPLHRCVCVSEGRGGSFWSSEGPRTFSGYQQFKASAEVQRKDASAFWCEQYPVWTREYSDSCMATTETGHLRELSSG